MMTQLPLLATVGMFCMEYLKWEHLPRIGCSTKENDRNEVNTLSPLLERPFYVQRTPCCCYPVTAIDVPGYRLPTYSHSSMSVHAVARSPKHNFSKPTTKSIKLLTGSRRRRRLPSGRSMSSIAAGYTSKPPPANLRQVHLISYEILAPLGIKPGAIGEQRDDHRR